MLDGSMIRSRMSKSFLMEKTSGGSPFHRLPIVMILSSGTLRLVKGHDVRPAHTIGVLDEGEILQEAGPAEPVSAPAPLRPWGSVPRLA